MFSLTIQEKLELFGSRILNKEATMPALKRECQLFTRIRCSIALNVCVDRNCVNRMELKDRFSVWCMVKHGACKLGVREQKEREREGNRA